MTLTINMIDGNQIVVNNKDEVIDAIVKDFLNQKRFLTIVNGTHLTTILKIEYIVSMVTSGRGEKS